MSADNYWYVRLDGDRYAVTMEFASGEPGELRDTDQRFDTVNELGAFLAQREEAGEWTEYGISYGPGVSERMADNSKNGSLT